MAGQYAEEVVDFVRVIDGHLSVALIAKHGIIVVDRRLAVG